MFRIPLRTAFEATVSCGACFLFAVVTAAPIYAQDTPAPGTSDRAHVEEVLRGLNRGRNFGQVAISPDGSKLAWIEGGRGGGEIRVASPNDLGKSEHVTAATSADQHCREGEFAWAPDSKSLAFFLRLRQFCGPPGGSVSLPARRDSRETPDCPEGDSASPGVLSGWQQDRVPLRRGATRPAGALAAMKPPSGVIGEDGVEVQRVGMASVNAATAPPRVVTPANLHVYEFNWAPDSKGIAYVAANPPGENNWWVAKLYTQSLDSEPKPILAPADVSGPLHGLQIAVPRWSPDGKTIAFIGGLMSDQGSTGGDVWIVPSAGGQPRDLSQGRPTSPAWIEWGGDDHLFVSELAGGNTQLIRYRLTGDAPETRPVTFGSPIFSIPGSVGDGRMEMSLSSTADHSLFVFRRQHL